LALGAREAGYLDISTAVVPDGPFSLIRYHLVTQREALAERSRELFEAKEATVAEKAELLAWERLLGNTAIIGRWQEVRQ
jgi:ubiquinone biosynthesis protein COQ9